MTEPTDAANPTQRWGRIFHGREADTPTHTRQEWRHIAEAIRVADAALHHTVGPHAPERRGDEQWCRVAVAAYERRPGGSDPAAAAAAGCYADEDVIRAWLTAPWVPTSAEHPTVADMTGLADQFRPDTPPDPAAVHLLVAQAQDQGLIGVPGHRIGLWRQFGDGTHPPLTFLLTVTATPSDGPGRSVEQIGAGHLLGPAGTPVDVIVGVLRGVAHAVNQLLAQPTDRPIAAAEPDRTAVPPDPVPAWVDGYTIGQRGHAFPPLRLAPPDTTAPGGDADVSRSTPHPRRSR